MTHEEVKSHLLTAAKKGNLMTPKHNPSSLGISYSAYRTVLSFDLATSLESFLSSDDYIIREYENIGHPSSPIYLEIEPATGSTFTVPASGVEAASPVASTALDRLVAVSGHNQGWHLFGEDSAEIQRKVTNGDLKFKGKAQ